MDNFSEKRGRPPAIPKALSDYYRALCPELRGRRSLLNWHYLIQAMKVIKDDPSCSWLMETRPNGEFKRTTVLYELGRLRDAELISAAARQLCSFKPKVKEAVVKLRRLRLEPENASERLEGDPLGLSEELLAAINDYLLRYPSTAGEAVLEALTVAWNCVEQQNTEAAE